MFENSRARMFTGVAVFALLAISVGSYYVLSDPTPLPSPPVEQVAPPVDPPSLPEVTRPPAGRRNTDESPRPPVVEPGAGPDPADSLTPEELARKRGPTNRPTGVIR